MNSLASILYSSSSANTKKRKNLSLQPSLKPITTKPSRCKVGMLFRSSTPKTPITKTTAHPTTSSTSSSSMFLSTNSPQSPRCSTPLFPKQRRTRPFIVCELCRQRAFQSLNEDEKKTKDNQLKTTNNKQQQSYHHQHSATLHYQTNNSTVRRCRDRRRSSIDQLLVWII